MKVYISGPMTGLLDDNIPAFVVAAAKLRASGFEVVSPHELPPQPTYQDAMREDVRVLLDCEAIVLLPDWQKSKGSCFEVSVAQAIGIPFFFFDRIVTMGPEDLVVTGPMWKPTKADRLKARKVSRTAQEALWREICRQVDSRDGKRCRACGRRLVTTMAFDPARLERHHIVPTSRGGEDRTGNVLCLCLGCHADRHAGRLEISGDADGDVTCRRTE